MYDSYSMSQTYFCLQTKIEFVEPFFQDTQPEIVPLLEIQNGTAPYWTPSPYAFIKVDVLVLLDSGTFSNCRALIGSDLGL